MKKILFRTAIAATAFVVFGFFSTPGTAQDINWDSVEGKQITLLYPGQGSWEWALTKSTHSGAAKFRQGKKCNECHEGEEQDIEEGEIIDELEVKSSEESVEDEAKEEPSNEEIEDPTEEPKVDAKKKKSPIKRSKGDDGESQIKLDL